MVREEIDRASADAKPTSEYLSTAEASSLARVSTGTIRRWINEERLKNFGAGREIRVRRDELEALMRPDGKRQRRRMRERPRAPVKLSPEEQAFADLGL